MKRRTITFIILATLLVGAGFFVHQEAQAITQVPPSLEYTVKPGESFDGFLKIINEETSARTLFVSTANFTAKDETGVPNFLFDAANSDLASWITVNLDSVSVEPQRTVQVPFRVAVPDHAEPGGYYAGIFFGTQPAAGTGQVAIGAKIGTLLIVRVEGEIREAALVKEFSMDKEKTLPNRLPVTLFARIENTGNVHVRPTGTITIKNMFGRVVKELPFNDAQGAVLPTSTRRFDVTWAKTDPKPEPDDAAAFSPPPPRGFFGELQAEWKNFAIGKHTATFAAEYGQTKQPLRAVATFTVFPWRVLTVSGIVLILALLLLIFGVKNYNAMIIRRAQQKMTGGNNRPVA